jgi:two-component system phosphate regulon sensor histidine kinase PhoR
MSLFPAKFQVPKTPFAALAIGAGVAILSRPYWVELPAIGITSIGIAAVVIGVLIIGRSRGPTSSSRRHVINNLQLLCQLDYHDLNEGQLRERLPPLGAGNPWSPAFESIRSCLTRYGGQLGDAEQGRAEAEVRLRNFSTERNRYRAILGSLSLPVMTMNHFGEVVYCNENARTLLHLPTDDSEISIDRLGNDELIRLLKDVRRRKLPYSRNAEVELSMGEGESRQFLAVCHGLETSPEEGEAEHGASIFLEDISEIKEIQRRNAEFVSSVSHEMKTPLTSIKAYVELLVDGDAEDEKTRDEFLEVINSQADRLQRLIHNLLNLARIEAGVVNVSKEQLSLNEVLEEAFNVIQPSAEQKTIRLKNELSPMYISVLADRDMLQQSAINLLSNAVKYTPEGGTVTLLSRLEDQSVLFEVTDTGVGLSPEDQALIFDNFYRVKKDKNMAQGTGLGLPLAKHIAEDVHGGTLQVTSDLGKGSTFTIRIPSIGPQKS